MNKITLLTAASLLLGTVAWAQITVPMSPGSVNATYQNTIASQNWDTDGLDPLTWGPPIFPGDFNQAVTMDVFFIGREASFVNTLGVYWEDGAIGGQGEYTQTLFDNQVTPGFTVSFSLEDGNPNQPTGFDFFLDSSANAGWPEGGIWSMFNQQNNQPNNPAFDYARGITQMVDGINYYLYAFEDVWAGSNFHNRPDEPDYDDFLFAVVLRDGNGDPITPIPEPSTYGALGIAFLLGLIGYRKFRARNGKAA